MSDAEKGAVFDEALEGLRNGDFSRLEPVFQSTGGSPAKIITWVEQGRFRGYEEALAEALTCACFNGRIEVAEYLLSHGIAPSGGARTGLNAIHWAANRGQLETLRLLIRHGATLESRSMYDATALGTAVWSAINEPRGKQLAVIEELLAAGARVHDAGYPTGREDIDALLKRFGAT
jgi:ankyrin repeat protein